MERPYEGLLLIESAYYYVDTETIIANLLCMWYTSVQFDQSQFRRVMSQVVAARCEIIQLWSSNQINQTWWHLACNVIHRNLGTSVISIDRQTGEVLPLTWLSEAVLLAKWSLTRFDAKAVKLWQSLFVIYHMIHMITCMSVSQQQLCVGL